MHRSPWWLTAAFDATVRPLLWDPERIVQPFVAPGDRVADIGCGIGFYARAMSNIVGPRGELFVVDVQEAMLERAVERLRRDPLARAKLTPVLSPADRVDLPGQFDFALLSWMLHEVERPRVLWESLREHLRPGGKALVIEPKLHVSRRHFEDEMAPAGDLGLLLAEFDDIFFCYAAVATRPAEQM